MFIQFGADILELILQVVCRLLNGVSIVTVELFSDVLDSAFQSLLLISRKPLPKLTQLFFALIRQIIGVVAYFCRFTRFPVFLRVCLAWTIFSPNLDSASALSRILAINTMISKGARVAWPILAKAFLNLLLRLTTS